MEPDAADRTPRGVDRPTRTRWRAPRCRRPRGDARRCRAIVFLPNEPLERAYANDAIATKFADGVSISSASQPAIVALMLEQLALAPGMNVLEIGAGTGYNAALMRTLVGPSGRVSTVDIDADITEGARAHLAAAGITDVTVVTADGAAGYVAHAPYDRIILTVNAGDIAPAWAAQLKAGGSLVLPLSVGAAQFSIAFEKRGDGLHSLSMQPCSFMPLRGSMGSDATGSRAHQPAPRPPPDDDQRCRARCGTHRRAAGIRADAAHHSGHAPGLVYRARLRALGAGWTIRLHLRRRRTTLGMASSVMPTASSISWLAAVRSSALGA